ncbi:hypothetical protein KA977_07960 [Candidatus Dependentiae bacterium]|nr:hypothetical protein [Candidatus Dependentiae bacterium]
MKLFLTTKTFMLFNNFRIIFILITVLFFNLNCNNQDFENYDNIPESPDFAAGTQPISVDFSSDTTLLEPATYAVKREKYDLLYKIPINFKEISSTQNIFSEDINLLLNPVDSVKNKIISVYSNVYDDDTQSNKILNSYITVSELEGFSENKLADYISFFKSEQNSKKYSVKFDKLIVNKIFIINQFLIFSNGKSNNESLIAVKLIFAPIFYEFIEINFFLNKKYYESNIKNIESSIGSFVLRQN